MAQRTNKKPANTKTKRTQAAKKNTQTKTRAAARKPRDQEVHKQRNQIVAILLFAFSVFLGCLVCIQGESAWAWMHHAFLGLFGIMSLAWPILLCYISIVIAFGRTQARAVSRIVMTVILIVVLCATVYIYTVTEEQQKLPFTMNMTRLYDQGAMNSGAGIFSGLFGIPIVSILGFTGAKIVILIVLFVMLMVLTGMTLPSLVHAFTKPAVKVASNIHEAKERKAAQKEYIQAEYTEPPLYQNNRKNASAPIDIALDDDEIPAYMKYQSKPAKKTKSEKLKKLEKVFNFGGQTENTVEQEENTQHKLDFLDVKIDPSESVQPPVVRVDHPEQTVPMTRTNVPSAIDIPLDEPKQQETTPIREDVEAVPVSASEHSETAAEAATFAAKAVEKATADVPATVEQQKEAEKKNTYQFPPVSMLEVSKELDTRNVTEELQVNGQLLVETLKSFGVQTKILDISRGPAVTRYELQPAAGVKISKITNLADDIAMNLAAPGVRIEAPIPGKAAVGIEVPNKNVGVVRMRDLVESNRFCSAPSKLTVALGRDISGQVTVADLAKMPHLLIAGSTGSGKSVCINSLIISLLYKATPDEVRFLMVDPKVVELGIYNGIPHLLVPVVTDPRKAAGALGWAVTEMLNRYKMFADNNVRDLASFNRLIGDKEEYVRDDGVTLKKMPQIVIIIDELADLMMAAPNEVEDSICRLAQMARAAGMHLVIATQRPSVDVITGIIKANIPSRIAFAVSSQIDSRTILDMGGAEKLLGRGDMLFAPMGSQKPLRVQGCYVDDREIESIVNFVKKSKPSEYDQSVIEGIEKNAVAEKSKGDEDTADAKSTDPMMDEAIKCVVEAGQASTSLLQRRLRLGYARAGRLIDEMEQMGIVGPHEGSKPRQVLITYQQWLEMTMQKNDAANEDTEE